MKGFLIHYHEIALKGANRPLFVKRLKKNIEQSLKGFQENFQPIVRILPGRLFLQLREVRLPSVGGIEGSRTSLNLFNEKLKRIPGIANFLPVFRVLADMEELKKGIAGEIKQRKFKSFKVFAKRGDKKFPKTSEEINKEIGSFVQEKTGAAVDLENPEFTLFIEVLPKEIFFGFEKIAGVGGLPVGISGKVAVLLSGGIDSPVAAFRMIKRGCRAFFVHFHAYPYVDYSSQEKAKELVKILEGYQSASKLYLVPFGDIQREIVLAVPEKYRVILYRRMMVRIAGEIARRGKAKALVTGESLGQVASQTMENISVIESAASLPIFRPLIGMDKQEIINSAKDIGTYEISIMPDQDCCQVFMPKHPSTKAPLWEIEKAEEGLKISEFIESAIESSQVIN